MKGKGGGINNSRERYGHCEARPKLLIRTKRDEKAVSDISMCQRRAVLACPQKSNLTAVCPINLK